MENKKEIILKNVGKLYLRFGIRGVTMDDIAREFGISKKTLYQYFTDKKELVGEVIEYYKKFPVFNLNEKDSGNAIDRIFAIREHVNQVIKYFNNNLEKDLKKTYPDLYKVVHRFKRHKIYHEILVNMEDGTRDGLYRESISPDLVAKIVIGKMLFTLNPDHGIFTKERLNSIELFDQVMDYHMHAICTPEGLEYYRKQLNRIRNEEKN